MKKKRFADEKKLIDRIRRPWTNRSSLRDVFFRIGIRRCRQKQENKKTIEIFKWKQQGESEERGIFLERFSMRIFFRNSKSRMIMKIKHFSRDLSLSSTSIYRCRFQLEDYDERTVVSQVVLFSAFQLSIDRIQINVQVCDLILCTGKIRRDKIENNPTLQWFVFFSRIYSRETIKRIIFPKNRWCFRTRKECDIRHSNIWSQSNRWQNSRLTTVNIHRSSPDDIDRLFLPRSLTSKSNGFSWLTSEWRRWQWENQTFLQGSIFALQWKIISQVCEKKSYS